jgi:hypothetical protein
MTSPAPYNRLGDAIPLLGYILEQFAQRSPYPDLRFQSPTEQVSTTPVATEEVPTTVLPKPTKEQKSLLAGREVKKPTDTSTPTTRVKDPYDMTDDELRGEQNVLLNKMTLTDDESRRLGIVTSILGQKTQKRVLEENLILQLIPDILGQREARATQAQAERRFRAQQGQAAREEQRRLSRDEQDKRQRMQFASLLPRLFPDLPFDQEDLSEGIDPELLPVLISLARLRSEQQQRQGTGILPTMRFVS